MVNIKTVTILGGAIILALGTAACVGYGPGFKSNNNILSNYHLFAATTGSNGGSGSGTTTGTGSGSGGSGSGTTTGTGGGSGGSTVPVIFYCDTRDTNTAGTNVYSAPSVAITVTDSSGQVVCSIPNAKTDIDSNGSSDSLNLSGCSSLTAGTYGLMVTGGNSSYNLLVQDGSSISAGDQNLPLTKNPVQVNLGADGVWSSSSNIYVLWDTNTKDSPANSGTPTCAVNGASPLIVDLKAPTRNSDLVDLTPTSGGVPFNILGANAVNYGLAANTPVKISWFKNLNYGMLTLPNANGQVKGIDQLFGNNTRLPDGTFKANGYLALAYYDSNHDSVIDQNDPVFSKLRIWKTDVDNYGVASQSSQLLTLSELGITQINLKYTTVNGNASRAEGNGIRLQSTATFADGKHDMYDLWFTIKLPQKDREVKWDLAQQTQF